MSKLLCLQCFLDFDGGALQKVAAGWKNLRRTKTSGYAKVGRGIIKVLLRVYSRLQRSDSFESMPSLGESVKNVAVYDVVAGQDRF